jgi:hypothetical protein
VIFSQRFKVFTGRTDGTFTTNANAFAAADALFHNADDLFLFNPDGFSWADPQT